MESYRLKNTGQDADVSVKCAKPKLETVSSVAKVPKETGHKVYKSHRRIFYKSVRGGSFIPVPARRHYNDTCARIACR